MTREVAIKAIQDFIGWFKEDSLIRKALEMAIQTLSQEPCEKSMNKAYEFGKNKGVGVYWNKQTDTVELPEAVFRYILSLVPTDKEIEA